MDARTEASAVSDLKSPAIAPTILSRTTQMLMPAGNLMHFGQPLLGQAAYRLAARQYRSLCQMLALPGVEA